MDLPKDAVIPLERARLRVVAGSWRAGSAAAEAVDQHWEMRLRRSPRMFNGRVFVITAVTLEKATLAADFVETDFKTFLAWREGVFTDEGVRDGFVFGLLRDSQGAIVLGRQAPGHLNAGFAYPPAGFIDAADVGPDGEIDVEGSIRRELVEEMGLGTEHVTREPGVQAVFCGPIIAVGVPFRARLPQDALIRHIRAHIARDPEPELDDVLVVATSGQAQAIPMTPHAALAVRRLLDREPGR